MKIQLNVLLIVNALAAMGCDSGNDPGGGNAINASTYFPYQPGDSMAYEVSGVLEMQTPYTDTVVIKVSGPHSLNGKVYNLHRAKGYQFSPYDDSTYFRVEGSKVYRWFINDAIVDDGEHLWLDFADDSSNFQGAPFIKIKDTAFVSVPAGSFQTAIVMSPGFNRVARDIYVPGVGKIYSNFANGVSVEKLLWGRVGGRMIP